MNESLDRVLADWLREGPENGPREGLERTLAATRRVPQRPGWTFAERWLPMQLTMARTPSLRPLLAIVLVALLTLALVAAALFIGSQRRPLPPPFGPARNGAVVYAEAGDLFIADQLGGKARTLISGAEPDGYPLFSNQGDKLAFIRTSEGAFQVLTALPDGSGERVLAELPGALDQMRWSPDGTALLVGHSDSGPSGLRLAVVEADGSGSRALDLGRAADYGSWRPDGRHIVFRGQLADGTAGVFIADANGTDARQLPLDGVDIVDFEGLAWSPDGKHLSFMTAGENFGTALRWQIGIADIDTNGEMTALHPMRLDTGSSGEMLPTWSPDSSRLAFLLEKDLRRQVGIFNADGTDYRVVGPETFTAYILSYAWSPDGTTLLITEFPEAENAREAARKMWSFGLATSAYTEVKTPVASWQRLAP